MPGRRGRGRPRGSRNTKTSRGTQTVKKVTAKGAYKKNVKNQMALRRAPIVETKQRIASDIAQMNGFAPVIGGNPTSTLEREQPLNWRPLVMDDAFTIVPLEPFYRMQRGLEEHNILGSSIFSKFLNTKHEFKFPDGQDITLFSSQSNNNGLEPPGTPYQVPNKMIQKPTRLYMICGWITQNWNCPLDQETDTQGNPLPGQRPQRDQATQAQLSMYISNQLRPYFDDDADKLQFRPKETTNIKVDKYVRIKPNHNEAIATVALPETFDGNTKLVDAQGSIPSVRKTWNAKVNRKIYYTQGADTGYSVDNQNLYPNDSWLPFCVIYNPEFHDQASMAVSNQDPKFAGRFTQIQAIQHRFNVAHYYTDS